MRRIEQKLDVIIDALADEGEEDQMVSIITMDGDRLDLPATGEFL